MSIFVHSLNNSLLTVSQALSLRCNSVFLSQIFIYSFLSSYYFDHLNKIFFIQMPKNEFICKSVSPRCVCFINKLFDAFCALFGSLISFSRSYKMQCSVSEYIKHKNVHVLDGIVCCRCTVMFWFWELLVASKHKTHQFSSFSLSRLFLLLLFALLVCSLYVCFRYSLCSLLLLCQRTSFSLKMLSRKNLILVFAFAFGWTSPSWNTT